MTTIATDGHTMAGDSQVTGGGERVGLTQKIWQTADGRIVGASGPSSDCQMFNRWMLDGGAKPTLASDNFSALILMPGGRVFYLCHKLEPVEYLVPQAIGSGAPYAIGAMMAGASPAAAVAISCERDTGSGGEIVSLSLGMKLEIAA